MKTRLELFKDAFPDESVLRGALHDLFMRIPKVRSVQLTHGSQEYGKDLVFVGSGLLGEPIISACVVKNFGITGTIDNKRGAGAVLNQVRQALTTAVVAADGSNQRISRVYVISPSPISQTALGSIQGQIQEHFGQVVFVCGHDLLELFETYYPEFLLLKSGFLTSYLELLRRAATDSGAFAHVSFKHGMLASAKLQTSRAYVRPTFSLEIRTLNLSLDQSPAAVSLGSGVDIGELEDLERFLNQTAELLQYQGRASVDPTQASKRETVVLAMKLRALRVSIRHQWEQGLKRRGGDRQTARIRIDRLQSELDSLVTAASVWCKGLEAASKSPLSYLMMQTKPLTVLSSHQYRTYGVYREMSKLCPEVCRLGPVLRSLKFGESLMDEVGCPLLITAPAGCGKTSFCKWSALNDAERFASGDSDIIPVYIPLHRFAQSVPYSFDEAFIFDVHLCSLIKHYKKDRGVDAKVRIYLDGLDEIPSERQKSVVSLVRRGIRRAAGTQVLLTARDHVSGEWLSWLPRVNIERLNAEKVRALVSQLLDHDQIQIAEFFRQLAMVPSLQHLMAIPLLATLSVALFAGMTKLAEGRTELYRIFVDLLCGGWDTAKGLKRSSAFASSDKQRVLIRLASRLHHGRSREASGAMIREIVKEMAPSHLGTWEGLVADMIQDGLLVREGATYIFSHLSFQEYLCARDLADPGTLDSRKRQILREYLNGDDSWQDVVVFYAAMSQKPSSIRRILLSLIEEQDPGRTRDDLRRRLTERMEALLGMVKGVENATTG